jgi:hypothetical protein
MMLVQALGSGTIGMAVASGISYTTVFQTLAGALGVVVVVLSVLYRADRLPRGGAPGEAVQEPVT